MASIHLAFWYFFGQGSAFLLQYALRRNGQEFDQGLAALYISLFSLCFQFADFGSSTYLVKLHVCGDGERIRAFLAGRILIAAILVPAIIYFIGLPGLDHDDTLTAVVVTAFAGALYASLDNARVESRSNYFMLGLVQAIPWLYSVLLLGLTFLVHVIEPTSLLATWLTFSAIYVFVLARYRGTTLGPLSVAGLVTPLAFILPPIAGQLWGRQMLFLIGKEDGLGVLATVTIVRSIHTAGALTLSFIIRPQINKLMTANLSVSDKEALMRKLHAGSGFMLILSVMMALLAQSIDTPRDDLSYWFPMLVGIPLLGITTIYSLIIQSRHHPHYVIYIEVIGVIVHIGGFLAIFSGSPNWAFVCGDVLRLVVVFCSYAILGRALR
jgi:hypothetical protein